MPQAEFVSQSHDVMGTVITVTAPRSAALDQAVPAVFSVFDDVDRTMSEWQSTSAVSQINALAGGAPVSVPASLIEVLTTAREISVVSDGAFDITWAALRGAWQFAPGHEHLPTPAELADKLALINYRNVEIDTQLNTVRLRTPGMAIGLGSIAKGYALLLAAQAMKRYGVVDYVIDAGGQVYAHGKNSQRRWRVGIQDPWATRGVYFATLRLNNASVSTSGDYESFFVRDGVIYHHIIDPHSGMPARFVRSVTVIAKNPTLADAASTAAFVLGPDKALLFAKKLGVEILMVDHKGALLMSDGMQKNIEILYHPGTTSPSADE